MLSTAHIIHICTMFCQYPKCKYHGPNFCFYWILWVCISFFWLMLPWIPTHTHLFLMPHETSAKARIQSKFPDTQVNIICTENSWPAKLAEEILLVFYWCSLVYFNKSTNSVPYINHPNGCCLVTQSCLTRCDPMDCSTPGFPVVHHPNGRYY